MIAVSCHGRAARVHLRSQHLRCFVIGGRVSSPTDGGRPWREVARSGQGTARFQGHGMGGVKRRARLGERSAAGGERGLVAGGERGWEVGGRADGSGSGTRRTARRCAPRCERCWARGRGGRRPGSGWKRRRGGRRPGGQTAVVRRHAIVRW